MYYVTFKPLVITRALDFEVSDVFCMFLETTLFTVKLDVVGLALHWTCGTLNSQVVTIPY
jgi:hypothetical protein